MKELMSLIMGLNTSVRQLSTRFDTFQGNIEGKVNRIQTEMVLMKNKVEFLEQNFTKNRPNFEPTKSNFQPNKSNFEQKFENSENEGAVYSNLNAQNLESLNMQSFGHQNPFQTGAVGNMGLPPGESTEDLIARV